MIWLEETYGNIKPQAIVIVLALVNPFIPNSVGLQVAQTFLQQIVVSLLSIPFVLAILVCTYPISNNFLLMLLYLYVRTMGSPVHWHFFP